MREHRSPTNPFHESVSRIELVPYIQDDVTLTTGNLDPIPPASSTSNDLSFYGIASIRNNEDRPRCVREAKAGMQKAFLYINESLTKYGTGLQVVAIPPDNENAVTRFLLSDRGETKNDFLM